MLSHKYLRSEIEEIALIVSTIPRDFTSREFRPHLTWPVKHQGECFGITCDSNIWIPPTCAPFFIDASTAPTSPAIILTYFPGHNGDAISSSTFPDFSISSVDSIPTGMPLKFHKTNCFFQNTHFFLYCE